MCALKYSFAAITAALYLPVSQASPLIIDGKLDEHVWQTAYGIESFFQVVPATHVMSNDKLSAKILADNAGIYIGITNYQIESRRKKQFNLQDSFMQAEFNRIYLDFSGDGSSAYLFAATLGGGRQDAVVTAQRSTDHDWDGDWQSAYYESPTYWSNEIFIPWHSVSFSPKLNEAGLASIGVGIQLYELHSNHIFANQKQTIANSDFFLNMPKVDIAIPAQSQLSFVPYVTHQHHFTERQNKHRESDLGFDLFYKPAHNQTLSVAVNPDFAQVDSDDVDVNYSAVETLTTDKRSFFTQDISVFNIDVLQDTKLIHTRRIGAGSDDGSELITPIDGAVRFVHQGTHNQLGGFAVLENSLDNEAGKQFYAGRYSYRSTNWRSGLLATHVERPWFDRQAQSLAWDSQYQNEKWSLQSALLLSQIDEKQRKTGNGASFNIGYQFSPNTSASGKYLRLNKQFDSRDMGYMKRNDWQYMNLNLSHAVNIDNDWLTRIRHTIELSYEANSKGRKLLSKQGYKSEFMMNNGTQWTVQIDYRDTGWQDNIGAQSAPFILPRAIETRVLYQSAFSGNFSWAASIEYDQEGLSGRAQQYALDMTWMPHENWNLKLNNFYRDGDGWLVANKQNQITEYDRRYFVNSIEVSALLADNLELSANVQWSILEAASKAVFTIGEQSLVRQSELDTSFVDKALMSQFKLRYRLGAYSDIYLVYRRGGRDIESLQCVQVSEQSWLKGVEKNWTQPDEDSVTFKVRYLF
ncbi:DUF5916 domain-containing protein [Pseudoalteromonas luteoviolacea]|uniref:DUF5916 domain-containing protein n=1 Tax=Pseudoalteromonas luteoviolacea S4054 TaxID=1129367 RepID=A0A0F6A886_9GAMM|nr:DUF5916 domain-containing protein [Pseudoalteromonas luteoviolacea]AOT09468.1 hypothetical protein S4054249_17135 [Pseudoalteromonas luteoviolacea]AOT14380.1 hypothetical protein S40542_17105 [Pseudoalteromonas luteoviolacea]AOT19296.1 hypothetical protein S4054_17110 [Pseudoalteromonas luteoviolacea]KKE81624.1 hypothetical protein N479_21830 [Pseudoalteromonas luteoviolacea S4054]KZN72433.1 hypothetical protein N481_15270 [Pseudoalteromonas luteoviolacea S4047-1]